MKSSFCLIFLAFFVASGSSFDLEGVISPDSSNFLQKYAMLKLYESCLGLDAIHKAKVRIREATAKCLRRPDLLLSITPTPLGSKSYPQVNRNPWMHQYVDTSPYKPSVVTTRGNLISKSRIFF